MKWGEVQPGWSFLYNQEWFMVIATYTGFWGGLDIVYLVTGHNGHIRFWNDTRRPENEVFVSPESTLLTVLT